MASSNWFRLYAADSSCQLSVMLRLRVPYRSLDFDLKFGFDNICEFYIRIEYICFSKQAGVFLYDSDAMYFYTIIHTFCCLSLLDYWA